MTEMISVKNTALLVGNKTVKSGGSVSAPPDVVIQRGRLAAEMLPSWSNAATVRQYWLLGDKPESEIFVPVVVATNDPLT